MKKNHLRFLAGTPAVVIGLSLLTGCGTTPNYKRADKTGAGIAEYREEIINGKKAIDATMAALDQIAATADTNPRKAFEQYSKAVDHLESTAAKVRKRGQEMREQGQAYFKQWEQQLAEVKNPEIRNLAAQQKAKLQAAFDQIKKVAEPLKTQFDPWMADLKDLRTYLGNDLTVTGVDAAKGLFTKTRAEGVEVQKSMDALVAELNTVAATLTPAKVQANK